MCKSIKLAILHALSSIYFLGSFACAFAIKPHPNYNNIHPSTTMAPNPEHTFTHPNFGTFDRQPLIHQINGHHKQRLHPLAMIPERRSLYEQNRNSTQSSRPLTFLDATKRRRDAETREISPELPKEESGISQITQPITKAITSFANSISSSKKLQGRAILLLVAFLYGTLNVTLRGVYATEGPPVASVLSLVRQVLSVIAFLPLFVFSKDENVKDIEVGTGNMNGEVEKVRPMWIAALELAFWNFGAQVRICDMLARSTICFDIYHSLLFILTGTHQCRPALQSSSKSSIPNPNKRGNDSINITPSRRKYKEHGMGRMCIGSWWTIPHFYCSHRWWS